MKELIDKSAIVAEIKKRANEYPCDNSEQNIGYQCALYEMQDFLNNLGVKNIDMTREEQIIEASQLYAKHQQKPFMDGALWADEHPSSAWLDKACEFLKSYRQDSPDGTGYIAGIVNDETIEDFRKYMEEQQ